jgi:hypothetical protein
MLCPVCGWQNFLGEETCDNCGADLRNADIPEPATSFHGRLLGEQIDELGAPPGLVDADADSTRRSPGCADGIDCPPSWSTAGWRNLTARRGAR